MKHIRMARSIFAHEIAELTALSKRIDATFSKVVTLFSETIDRRGKIIVLGVGKSGHIAEKIAATLTSTGAPSIVLDALNAVHGDLGVVSDNDVLLILSYSGKTPELVPILQALRNFDARIVAMTGNATSPLGKAAHHVLETKVSREACPLNLAPTSSTTAMLVLGDALAMVLLEERGFKKENFAKFHPGGALGQSLLMKAQHIMRPPEACVMVPPETPVREVLAQMREKRSGAAVVVAPKSGKLAGIFTHGDFIRHFETTPDVLRRAVKDVMTPRPVAIKSDAPVADALKIFQQRRIDDLVVVDKANHPVGIIDSQDITRARLV